MPSAWHHAEKPCFYWTELDELEPGSHSSEPKTSHACNCVSFSFDTLLFTSRDIGSASRPCLNVLLLNRGRRATSRIVEIIQIACMMRGVFVATVVHEAAKSTAPQQMWRLADTHTEEGDRRSQRGSSASFEWFFHLPPRSMLPTFFILGTEPGPPSPCRRSSLNNRPVCLVRLRPFIPRYGSGAFALY